MRIQQIDHKVFESRVTLCRCRWLADVFDRISELPIYPAGRILAAVEGGQIVAVLGLLMKWTCSGRPDRATIPIYAVDPGYETSGVCSRLLRFAEGISRLSGFRRVDLTPDPEGGSVDAPRTAFSRGTCAETSPKCIASVPAGRNL